MEDEDYDAHDFLKATYQNHALSEATRIKAAAAAIRFERPSLSASLNVDLKQVDPAMTARLQKTWERLHGLRAARKAGQVAEYCRGEAPEFDALPCPPMPEREPYPAHLPQDAGSKTRLQLRTAIPINVRRDEEGPNARGNYSITVSCCNDGRGGCARRDRG